MLPRIVLHRTRLCTLGVLYLSFAMPQQATDSVMDEDGNVYHYHGEQLVGVTILHASKRAQDTGE